MKKFIIAVLLATLFVLPACTEKDVSEYAYSTVSSQSSTLQDAKDYLASVKEQMAAKVKPDYFESKEWYAFVDAFWDGYNKGQAEMKDPQYMPKEEIVY